MYYFASDTHLGLRVGRTADDRERLFVRWLDEVSADAEGIFLVGDIFDFWYEYKRVVPRGFTRLLGRLSIRKINTKIYCRKLHTLHTY